MDTIRPKTPLASSTDYPTTGVNGTVGRTGTFTFKSNGNTGLNGTMDVRRYGWSLNNDTAITNTVEVPAGGDGTVTLPITPTQAGTNVLYVTAIDRAGNRSATSAVYTFRVAEPAIPLASWRLDETSGSTAGDASGGGRPLTLTGGASFGSGYDANGMVLNGTTAHATAGSPVVDASRAFTISAWVRLDNTNGFAIVANQDGTHVGPFYLEYSKDVDRWTMSWTPADANPASIHRATSAAPPQVGVWTHLLGTYEPNSLRLALYVNGKLEGTTTATLWKSTGNLIIGAGRWGTPRVNHFPGRIDAVRVWDRELSADEAAVQANEAVARARLSLDEQTGTTTLEQVSGQQATLSVGVTWSGNPADPDDPNDVPTSEDKWVKFPASGTDSVTAQRPALLRSDRSYTVSAWARLDSTEYGSGAPVSLGDTGYTPFQLQYRSESKQWGFLVNRSATQSSAQIALSDQPAQAGQWVHLVGTFDYASGRMALYVNGQKQAVNFLGTTGGTGVSSWNGGGPLWLGRTVWAGSPSNPWRGDVDDARVYSGVLTAEQISQLYFTTQHH